MTGEFDMATYDLIIRNGTIVDGTGAPRFAGDVAVKDGLIAAVGTVRGDATRVRQMHHMLVKTLADLRILLILRVLRRLPLVLKKGGDPCLIVTL